MTVLNWDASTKHLAGACDRDELRAGLLDIADDLGPLIIGSGVSPKAWRALGLRVAQRDLGNHSGLAHLGDGARVVQVNSRENPRRQRFTVAHEMAHMLMARVERGRIGLPRAEEELLADEYAQRLLVPRADLMSLLPSLEPRPAAVLSVSRRYGVSLSVALNACGDWFTRYGHAFFAASVRGHPARPREVALRAHRARCGELLIPDLVRVSSLGLAGVESADPGLASGAAEGEADAVELRLWRPRARPRSGVARGPARWESERMRTGITLVGIDIRRLKAHWWAAESDGELANAA
jgi:uncharacterized protein DUF955